MKAVKIVFWTSVVGVAFSLSMFIFEWSKQPKKVIIENPQEIPVPATPGF